MLHCNHLDLRRASGVSAASFRTYNRLRPNHNRRFPSFLRHYDSASMRSHMRGSAERRADQTIGRARHLHAQINATRAGRAGALTIAVSNDLHIFTLSAVQSRQGQETSLLVQKMGAGWLELNRKHKHTWRNSVLASELGSRPAQS